MNEKIKAIKDGLNSNEFSREELLIELFSNNEGNLDLRGLDFSDFEGNVIFSKMMLRENLYITGVKTEGTVFQWGHKANLVEQQGHVVRENILQGEHLVKGNVFQEEIICESSILQHGHDVSGCVFQGEHTIGEDLYQHECYVDGSVSQSDYYVGGDLYQCDQEVVGSLFQSRQSVRGSLLQANQDVLESIIQSWSEAGDTIIEGGYGYSQEIISLTDETNLPDGVFDDSEDTV